MFDGYQRETDPARLHADFKLAVVDDVEKGELTYKQAQLRYGIQGRSTVLVWLRKHGRQDWGSLKGPNQRRSDPVSKQAKSQTPGQRIKELETQLKDANQKTQLFEAMLEVIRKELGVKLPKKPSGESSSKGR